MRRLGGPALLAVLSVPSLGAAAPALPLPCGLADPAGRTGYLSNPAGGLDAVDLVTGDLLWQTSEAQRPLLVAGDRLYAQAGVKRNRLRVLAFDAARKGEVVLESDPVVLPTWAVACDGPGRSFAARWELERDALVLRWEARAWPTGPRPSPQAEAESRKHAAGVARIDLATGKVTQSDEPPPTTPRPPKELEKLAVRWQGVVGARTKALVLEDDGGQQKLVLRSWGADGVAGPSVELLAGKRLVAQATVDDRFLCVRDAFPSPDVSPEDARKRFGWSIHAVETGERKERAPFEPGTQAIALAGPRVYYLLAGPLKGPIDRPFVQPRSVVCVDLRTGRELWRRPVEGKLVTPPAP
jgi:hypothetical protein